MRERLGAFCHQMNVPPILIRDHEFLELREKIGPIAMHALVALGTTLQSKKTTRIRLAGPRHLALACDVSGDVDPQALWDAMLGTWIFPCGKDEYDFPLFEENNLQLISNWENGRKKKEKAMQAKVTEPNSEEDKSKEENSTQLNSDANSVALSNASGSASNAWVDEEVLLRNHGISAVF